MTLVAPPAAPQQLMMLRLVEVVSQDADLISYFGWEVVGDDEVDWDGRRRIFLDDNGTCDEMYSPKLCMTALASADSFNVLGNGADVASDAAAQVYISVYVTVAPTSNGESEKLLVENLHAAVRKVVRQNVVDEPESGDALWGNSEFVNPSVSFDQSDSFRRAGGVVILYNQQRTT